MRQRTPFGNPHRRRAIEKKRAAKLGQPETYGLEPLEKEIAGDIVRALRLVNYHVSSTQQTRASRQTEGMPDLFVAHPVWRVFAWAEVKRPGEQLRPSQQEWHDIVRASGCPVLTFTGPEDALRQLEQLRREWRRAALTEATDG